MAFAILHRFGSLIPLVMIATCFVGAVEASASEDDQVDIKIQIVEIERDDVQALAIEWMNETDQTKSINFGLTDQDVLSSLDQDAFRRLVESNMAVSDGEPDYYQSISEVPVTAPIPGGGGKVRVDHKPLGLSLDVLPTLLSDDRIDLRVRPAISFVSSVQTFPDGFEVPGFTYRRAGTSVELTSGQTFAISRLLQAHVVTDIEKFPFLDDEPLLGGLFQSSRFQRGETELIILVTPYLV